MKRDISIEDLSFTKLEPLFYQTTKSFTPILLESFENNSIPIANTRAIEFEIYLLLMFLSIKLLPKLEGFDETKRIILIKLFSDSLRVFLNSSTFTLDKYWLTNSKTNLPETTEYFYAKAAIYNNIEALFAEENTDDMLIGEKVGEALLPRNTELNEPTKKSLVELFRACVFTLNSEITKFANGYRLTPSSETKRIGNIAKEEVENDKLKETFSRSAIFSFVLFAVILFIWKEIPIFTPSTFVFFIFGIFISSFSAIIPYLITLKVAKSIKDEQAKIWRYFYWLPISIYELLVTYCLVYLYSLALV